jgi:uncharacterized protein
MSEQENLEVVRKGYEAFRRGDVDSLLGLLAEDVEWIMPEVPERSFTGTCRGRSQVREFFAALEASEETLEFTLDEFIVTGHRVAVTGRYGARVRATGRTFATPFAHLFTVADGQVRSFQEYYDTLTVADACRSSREARS